MKMKFSVAVTIIGVLAACSDTPTSTRAAIDVPDGPSLSVAVAPDFVPGEIIVKFRAGASATGRAVALGRANGRAGERILTAMMRRSGDAEGLTIVHTSLGVPQAVAALRGSPDVEYAEPNYIYQHSATLNDPYYTNGSLWGMYGDATSPTNQYGSQAGEAWAKDPPHNDCGNVYVGIIDEGYMYTHEDLAANAGKNPGEIAGNRFDDDGNGYVDDVYGWDFDGNDNTVFDGIADDHGTHVAGTIGGAGGNGIGVAGVCWSVKLMNAKFLGRRGGTTANAIKAVDYFTELKTQGLNIVATSNSWGGGGYSEALELAIGRANTAGILFIAAAGNSAVNCDTGTCYPAEYPNANVIAVASIDSDGAMSSFSNYGATTIDIGAPGRGIYSTVPAKSRGKIVPSYASYSGTSMATPHVSGAAALYKAYHSAATAAEIKKAILDNVVLTESLTGKVVSNGRLNVSGF